MSSSYQSHFGAGIPSPSINTREQFGQHDQQSQHGSVTSSCLTSQQQAGHLSPAMLLPSQLVQPMPQSHHLQAQHDRLPQRQNQPAYHISEQAPTTPKDPTEAPADGKGSAKRVNGEDEENDSEGDDKADKKTGRRKIKIEYITDKSRRHITFSKRKHGIMKKAFEISTLTGTQVLLLVVSETGLVYTFTTPKLQPLVTKPEGKNLIQACLNAPDYFPTPAQEVQPEMAKNPSLYSEPLDQQADKLYFGRPPPPMGGSMASVNDPYKQYGIHPQQFPPHLPIGNPMNILPHGCASPGFQYSPSLPPYGSPTETSFMSPTGYWPSSGSGGPKMSTAFSTPSSESPLINPGHYSNFPDKMKNSSSVQRGTMKEEGIIDESLFASSVENSGIGK